MSDYPKTCRYTYWEKHYPSLKHNVLIARWTEVENATVIESTVVHYPVGSHQRWKLDGNWEEIDGEE